MQRIGVFCPKLEVLKLPAVLEQFGDLIPSELGESPTEEMTILQSLRVCVIERLVPFNGPNSSIIEDSKFSYAIGWLLRGMPVLEEFTLGHGRMWDMADETNRFLEERLPKIGDGLLMNVPRFTIRKVHFIDIQVDASCPYFPFYSSNTESFTFKNCVGSPMEALAKLSLSLEIPISRHYGLMAVSQLFLSSLCRYLAHGTSWNTECDKKSVGSHCCKL